MPSYTPVTNAPLALSSSTISAVYGLFAVAIGLTAVGVGLGMQFASTLLQSGFLLFAIIAEFAILLSARAWVDRAPLNYFLFGAFPLACGLTITPYLMSLLAGYVNGASILLNALAATTFMALAAAVLARASGIDLSGLGRFLFLGVLGLIGFSLLQIFVPAMRTTGMELGISIAGVVIFALFTAYDLQRITHLSRLGASPFLLAMSLYLDIFNLFLYVLRLMVALSGNRR